MRATCAKRGLGYLRVCALSCFVFLLCSTCGGQNMASHQPTLRRSRRSHQSAKDRGAHRHHHRPLTDEQKADQNLQFMLSLYHSAAEPDGRPKQHRKFGSNTVRLLRPTASSVHYLPASGDHCYTFTVQYNLDTLPSERLVRASFVHLRSSPPSSSSTNLSSEQAVQPPRCRAQITALGAESLVTLEPHERWTETDITAHISSHVLRGKDQGRGRHLTLTAQYWCTEPELAEESNGLLRWWRILSRGRTRWSGEPHLEVPSLLLYLEEEREVKDWMGELLGTEGEGIMRQIGQWHLSLHRRRRSKDSSEPQDPSLDALKNAPTSSSSFSTPTSSLIVSDIPSYKHKTNTPKNRCKLHSFRLSFDELGWGHYFIAPPVYNPRFCQAKQVNQSQHALYYTYRSPHDTELRTFEVYCLHCWHLVLIITSFIFNLFFCVTCNVCD
uniref:TGF-beta family profile domain-containing protein n=1 Tax=Neolamprologus brichardi TaxID=32507 RepID=A0A3Q4GYK4_NEOBR